MDRNSLIEFEHPYIKRGDFPLPLKHDGTVPSDVVPTMLTLGQSFVSGGCLAKYGKETLEKINASTPLATNEFILCKEIYDRICKKNSENVEIMMEEKRQTEVDWNPPKPEEQKVFVQTNFAGSCYCPISPSDVAFMVSLPRGEKCNTVTVDEKIIADFKDYCKEHPLPAIENQTLDDSYRPAFNTAGELNNGASVTCKGE